MEQDKKEGNGRMNLGKERKAKETEMNEPESGKQGSFLGEGKAS